MRRRNFSRAWKWSILALACILALAIVIAPSLRAWTHHKGTLGYSVSRRDNVRLIPKIIHTVFLSGQSELERDSRFSRAWMTSCETHNPTYEVMFWDRAAGEALLAAHYPWFLPVFQNLSSVVLQSDALRVFILHAHGGLYLDLDTECYVEAEESLAGNTLVLQAEEDRLLNNAQMASTAGHPFWPLMFHRATAAASAGIKDPLYAAGPHAITDAYKEYMGHDGGSGPLHGTYPDPGWQQQRGTRHAGRRVAPGNGHADGHAAVARVLGKGTTPAVDITEGRVRVYAPGEWFTPCRWDDWNCQVRLARSKSQLRSPSLMRRTAPGASSLPPGVCSATCHERAGRQGTHGATEPNTAWSSALKNMVDDAHGFAGIIGAHHFSGSWLGFDASKSRSLQDEAAKGLHTFFTSPAAFVEVCPSDPDNCNCCGNGGTDCRPSRTWAWPLLPRTACPDAHLKSEPSQEVAPDQTAPTTSKESPSSTAMPAKDGSLVQQVRPACIMLSIVRAAAWNDATDIKEDVDWTGLEEVMHMAALEECDMTIVTDTEIQHPGIAQALANRTQLVPRVDQQRRRLALVSDPHAPMPLISLPDLVDQLHWDRRTPHKLVALHVSCPGSCVWEVISQLHVQDSEVLQGEGAPGMLLLNLGLLLHQDRHHVHSVYQHLYQEAGYLGYYHHLLPDMQPRSGSHKKAAPDESGSALAGVKPQGQPDSFLPGLQLGFVKKNHAPGCACA